MFAWLNATMRQNLTDLEFDLLMLVVPWFGTNISLMPVIGAVVIWLWAVKRRADLAMWLLVVQLGSWALNPLLKGSFDRVRPDLFPKRGWFGWTWPLRS